jgi:hypothetical protein
MASALLPSPDYPGGPAYESTRSDVAAVGDAAARLGISWAGSLGARLWARAVLGVQLEYLGFGGQQLVEFSNDNVHPLDGLFSVGPFLRCEIAY